MMAPHKDQANISVLLATVQLIIVLLYTQTVSSVPVNVAQNKPISALYTCGVFGKESFNTMSDVYRSVSERPRRTCESLRVSSSGSSPPNGSTYPPKAMVDGSLSTYWQSVSRSRTYLEGVDLQVEKSRALEAMIDIDLLQEFLAENITIRLGDALTPQKVSIQKSLNGKTFQPWIYAVANLDDCSTFFQASIKSVPSSLTDTICVNYVANDQPPGDVIAADLSKVTVAVKEWQRVRYLKIRFYDMLFIYPYNSLANSFNHYSVLEITTMAECPCNGQQEGCEVSPTSGMYECICGGNTRGRFCESCLPLFNQFPFRYGEACEACNCFGHATSCFYQTSVETEGLSLDKDGNIRGGGVCTDCQHNTAGVNCEKCADLYYRPAGKLQTDVDACIPCQCNASGSAVNPETGLADCLMNDDQPSTDGRVPGDCYCKANVEGSSCTICKSGFYNLQQSNPEGCTPCACHTPGTAGGSKLCVKDASGQCSCKTNVEGRACNQCKDGFFGLAEDNVHGCSECDCDVGGSVDQICDKSAGQCVCRNENIIGRRCDEISTSFYYPMSHGFYAELEDGLGETVTKRDPQYAGFSGQGYAVVTRGSTLSTLLTVPAYTDLSMDFILIIRYISSTVVNITIQIEAAEVNKTLTPLSLPACPSSWCEVNTAVTEPIYLSSGPNLIELIINSGEVFLDKLVAFPVEYLQPDEVLTSGLPAGCDLLKNTMPSDPAEAAACKAAIFSLTLFYLGAPLPCDCDPIGSVTATCDVSGGQCECQPGVVGRTCDRCAPDHYGFSSTGCSACNCDEFSNDCDSVTGQCQCPERTMGRQCQFCEPNTWGWNKTTGCQPCDCNTMGSINLQCSATNGVCMCRIGVEGEKCDQCQDGFYNLTSQGCAPCLCNEAGSSSGVCNKTSGQCDCKANTAGRQCDTCVPGTFGLNVNNTEGCLDCVCMGITSECVSAGIRLSSEYFQLAVRTDLGSVPTLSLANEDGSAFSLSRQLESNPDGTTAIVVDLTETDPRLYWTMPPILWSNLLSLYGSDIKFTVNFVVVDGQVLTDHKVLLKYGDGNALVYSLGNIAQGSDSKHILALREDDWQKVGAGTVPTRGEFLKALASCTAVLVPASFGDGKHTSRISRVEFSKVSSLGPVNIAVEQCVCGDEYEGMSCQSCAPGYRRENVSSSDYFGVCVPCECNGHTVLCHPDTAACQDCLHNTAGDSCESCLPGFYGNATMGTETDCTECPCYFPRVLNATCEKDLNTTDVICSFCQEGYIGNHCDECDLLYYGNPQTVNGTCLPCECNGNSDTCDSVTGICDSCSYNTTGSNCESCVVGFYGNATLQDCKECDCLPSSSNSTVCDSMTGQCSCIYGVGGRTCDQCWMGFWGFESTEFDGCKACGCLEAGSTSVQCNNDTGLCPCKPNTVGDQCDTCEDGYYGLPVEPCQACGCDSTGSVEVTQCNKTTGQCECQPGVGGRLCDQCLPFFVNFTDTGCDECGECPKSVGDNVQTQLQVGEELLTRTLEVRDVQMQDVRLQNLTARLNQSLEALGLAGSSATSLNDIVQNVTGVQNQLVSNFSSTEAKVSTLSSSVYADKDKSDEEVARQGNMEEMAANLTRDLTSFEQIANDYLLYMTEYNSTASLYLNHGAEAGNGTLNFQGELDSSAKLLAQAENTAALDATVTVVNKQASDVTTVTDSVATLTTDFDAAAFSITNLTSALNSQSYDTATVENTLGQATIFRSQVEDLRSAVNSILNYTENRNRESVSALAAARTAARNTNSVYNGNAKLVMTGGEFLPFPNDVTNFESGTTRLKNLQSSIPLLIERVSTAVNASEDHVLTLETSLSALKSIAQNISSIGTEAVQAIEDYEQVVTNIEASVSTIETANKLITEVRGNISGANLERLEQEYSAEKESAEAWRSEIMDLDYQPQVIQNSLDTANSRLDSESAQWAQADAELASMTAAAQILNGQIKDDILNEQLASATTVVNEALTTAQTAAASVAAQDEVLRQKQSEMGLVQGQMAQTQELDEAVRKRLTSYETERDALQSGVSTASTLSQEVIQKTNAIADKIQLLESKLANAESMLTQLRQPVTFDGSLGLELNNLVADVAHLSDDVVLEMRKPANFTNGVVFFVDNPATDAELEIGLLNNSVFFEFNTGTKRTRVTSPAEICDNCWTRIYASRYATVGHLTVTLLSTGGVVSTSARGQEGALTRMTLSSNLFVGTLPDTQQTAKVSNRVFRGCLHNLEYQGEELSLWTSSSVINQAAKCCQSPPILPGPTITPGASFTGFGYLVISPGSLQFSQTRQLSMEFRTFSVNASMFKVVSLDGQTHSSFHLSNGHVVWETLAGGSRYTVQSPSQFATGHWVQVLAEGTATEFKLSVNYANETGNPEVTSTPVTSPNLTSLDNQNFIIGSASDPSSVGYSPGNTNFAGCLRSISITTSSGTSQLSFTDNVVSSAGVTTDGCFENVINGLNFRSASSYARLAITEQLQQLRKIEFDIVTNHPNGMLMYINAPGALRFLYLAVLGGNVLAVYRQEGSAIAIVSSSHYVSDGQSHTIEVDCRTRRVSLKVDGAVFEDPSPTLTDTNLVFSASTVMWLGGVTSSIQLQPECTVKHSLVGGITRLLVNDRPISFIQSNTAEQNEISLAGISAPAITVPEPPIPEVPTPQVCATATTPTLLDPFQGFIMNGAQSINWSQLVTNINLAEYFERNFALSVGFSAFKADGVLLYMADVLDNPNFYFTLYFLDGILHLRMRTTLNIVYDVHLANQYNDGQRHELNMMKINDFASMEMGIDKDYVNTEADSTDSSRIAMPPGTSVYVGGIGTNNLATSALPGDFKSQTNKVGFAGAIYSIQVRSEGAVPANVTFPISSLDRAVYPAIPRDVHYGVGLSGVNSFLGLGPVDTPSQNFTLEITFSTVSDSGLFFLMDRSTTARFVAMDMSKQDLRLHLYPSYSGVTDPLMMVLYKGTSLCDGQPHTVTLKINDRVATATVDGDIGEPFFIPASHALQPFYDAEFYIGGFTGVSRGLPENLNRASLAGCVMAITLTTTPLAVLTNFDPTQFISSSAGVSYGCPY